ncbi:hypothetical protein E7Z59_08435 [Robertkochia marina]|uniref:DUF4249 domain-containing protein n=1 Tax=Robertkochia marina TaxID=1227945 RepID=A0A4S3LZY1_9FLAO|nr:hypothetical protein [Robertkochia marina]THD67674.1 hypothetical protein E7Z59_08435 [Robertkochia marina]TRZ43405.1 hypothetical protein D3A96_10575 [Robertkochia marina]
MKKFLMLLMIMSMIACSKDDSPQTSTDPDVGKVSLTINNGLLKDQGQIGAKGSLNRTDDITDLAGLTLNSVETSVLKGNSVNLTSSQSDTRAVRIIGVADYQIVTQTYPRRVYIRYFVRTPNTNENYRILFQARDSNGNVIQEFLTGSQIEVGREAIYETFFEVDETFPTNMSELNWTTEYRVYSTATDYLSPVLAPEVHNTTSLLNATDEWECSLGTYIVPHRINRRVSYDDLEWQLGQDDTDFVRFVIDNPYSFPLYMGRINNRYKTDPIFEFDRIEIPAQSTLFFSMESADVFGPGGSAIVVDIPLYREPTASTTSIVWSQELSIPGIGFRGEEDRLFTIQACDSKDHFNVVPVPVTIDCTFPETPTPDFPTEFEVLFLNNPERPGEQYSFYPVSVDTPTEFDIPLGVWDVQVQSKDPADPPIISYSDNIWLIDYDAGIDFRSQKTFSSEVYTLQSEILVAKKNHSTTEIPFIKKFSTNAVSSITRDVGDYWVIYPVVNDVNTDYTLTLYDERNDPYEVGQTLTTGMRYRFILCPSSEVGIQTNNTLFQEPVDETIGQKFIQ